MEHEETNYINLALAERQGLDEAAIKKLNKLHEEMRELKTRWAGIKNPTICDQTCVLMDVEDIEFDMQETWGFNQDAARHTHRTFFSLPDGRK
jgi:hypothetical protein